MELRYLLILSYYIPGKYLQAVRALNHAKVLDADHPELHVRTLHLRKLCLFSSHISEPY